MPSVEKMPDPARDQDAQHRARLTQWRQQREKIAEVSRQERLRLEEAERQKRMRRIEEARIARAVEEAEARGKSEADSKAARMIAASTKLADRSDIDATRERITQARRRAARRAIIRGLCWVVAPVLAISAYLFFLATPMHVATARFRIAPPTNAQAFVTPEMIRDIVHGTATFAQVDAATGYVTAFSDRAIDPLHRLWRIPGLGMNPEDHFRRFARVGIRANDGAITLTTRAPDAALAQAISGEIFGAIAAQLEKIENLPAPAPQIYVYQHISVSDQPIVENRLALLAYASCFVIAAYVLLGAVLAAIRRHNVP